MVDSARASASKGKVPIDPEVDDRYGEPELAARWCGRRNVHYRSVRRRL